MTNKLIFVINKLAIYKLLKKITLQKYCTGAQLLIVTNIWSGEKKSTQGVLELRNAGSTEATLAVRNACIQNSRPCSVEHSSSWNSKACAQRLYTNICSCKIISSIAFRPTKQQEFISLLKINISNDLIEVTATWNSWSRHCTNLF